MQINLFPILLLFAFRSVAQQIYSIDASHTGTEIITGQLKLGNPGPSDKKILINNRYMTLNGIPIVPVMGEMHFSRVPRSQWEDVILKMKACGVNIVACYLLWIHHEEIEGQFDWDGNKDLRAFVRLCARHGLWVYPRIGPWCHAEVRNGGTPDWVMEKRLIKNRSNDPVYQHYAERWYEQVGLQLKGLLYKDGGPVMGVQLENEYCLGKAGEDHILWLKRTALKYGIDVPMYTVTGWQNGSVPPYEVIPLWGAYPDEPWGDHLDRNTDCSNFQFTPFRDNKHIGNAVPKAGQPYMDYNAYPFFTCEMGVGIENTEHRRLQIGSIEGLALITAKIGSGSNLAGYYMFAGGSNPHGILTTMEENKEETGSYNTNPVISYDFQAAVRESGELNGCYYEIKKLHYFLNEFGNLLAPMEPVLPGKREDFQFSVRAKGNSAFLFGLNYCRHNITSEKKNVRFSIQLKDELLTFPSKPITIPDSSMFIWPINFPMEDVLLKYATVQPLCHIDNKWIFVQDGKVEPEFCFDSASIHKIESYSGTVSQENGKYIITGLQPGVNCVITIHKKNDQVQNILLLSEEESKHAWLFDEKGKRNFFLSDANMYMNGTRLHVFGASNKFRISMLDIKQNSGIRFIYKDIEVPEKKLDISFKEVRPLEDAKWLKTSTVDRLDTRKALMHRFFVKEFSLGNPSKIKRACLAISPQSECRVKLNGIWVNQNIVVDSLNMIDVTGYVQKGGNNILLDFPYENGSRAFAAKLSVEYFNSDQIELITDQSWITKDAYVYPTILTKDDGYKEPQITSAPQAPGWKGAALREKKAYSFDLPFAYLESLNNLYLHIRYTGDKAALYLRHHLIADDFNNGTEWTLGLNRFDNKPEGQTLTLSISALSPEARIYFDDEGAKRAATTAELHSIRLVPEYSADLNMMDGDFGSARP